MKFLSLLICVFLKFSICDFIENGRFGTFKGEISEHTSTKLTRIAALGREADLGDLYDAKTEHFPGVSMYGTHVPSDAVQTIKIARSSTDYVRTESLLEKFQKLDVSSSLSISYLAGLVEVSGSAKYLNEYKETSNSAKTSIIYKFRTVRENLKILFKTSKDSIDTSLLDIGCTHVVVGIDWGTDFVLSFEETNTNSLSFQERQKRLEDISELSLRLPSSPEVANIEESATFKTHIHADVIPSIIPHTIKDSIGYIRNVSQFIQEEHNGKGKKMSYVLMPLATIRKGLQLESKKTETLRDIDREVADEFITIFQEMKLSELSINDVYNNIAKCPLMIPKSDYDGIANLKKKFASFKYNLTRGFTDLVFQFRNGDINDNVLKNFTATYEIINLKPEKINELLQAYKPLLNKITLSNLFQKFGASSVCHKEDANIIFEKSYEQDVKIISVDLTADITSDQVREIMTLLKAEKDTKYFIEDDSNSTFPIVKSYSKGKLLESVKSVETVKSVFTNRKEYVIILSFGEGILLDGKSFDQISTFEGPNLNFRFFAVVSDMLYSIHRLYGFIESTDIRNFITSNVYDIKWNRETSCKIATNHLGLKTVTATNGSSFYIVTPSGFLYKYDTTIKNITDYGKLLPKIYFPAAVVVNDILYIYTNEFLYSFDGASITNIPLPETVYLPGLFETDGNVCCVDGHQPSVSCYDVSNRKWTVAGYTNEARMHPTIVKTIAGTVVFGGFVYDAFSLVVKLNSAEIFYNGAHNSTYISTFSGMRLKGLYSAFTFYV